MKIEKLTENKIRVIINLDELDMNNDTNIHNIMNSQSLFLDILKKAEKEVDFNTDGCKLLIEVFSSIDDFFVFTITKYLSNKSVKPSKLKPIARCKSFNTINDYVICNFNDFDSFCEFCKSIKSLHKINCSKLTKNASLYLWKSSYYLILKNINIKSNDSFLLYALLSEFAKIISFSDNFENKLLEYGTSIIKKDALNTGIKFFAK